MADKEKHRPVTMGRIFRVVMIANIERIAVAGLKRVFFSIPAELPLICILSHFVQEFNPRDVPTERCVCGYFGATHKTSLWDEK